MTAMYDSRLRDYAVAFDQFEWTLPETFNFGRDVVDRLAAQTPDKLAMICCNEQGSEGRYSFGDVARASSRLANLLTAHGVRRGDRVVVMLPRIAHWQVAMIGCLKCGAIPIPCIDMLTAKDIRYRVEHSGAVAAITTASQVDKFAGLDMIAVRIAVGPALGWLDFDLAVEAQSDAFTCADLAMDEPALMFYTSGSTGQPKGVLHAARALYVWRHTAWCWLDLDADDLMWCTADTGWAKAGTSMLFGPWWRGSAVLFYDGRFDAHERLVVMARYGVTVFCGAATEFRHLVNEAIEDHDLRRLRLALSAGEVVNPAVLRRWEVASHVPLIEAYGQTETLMIVGNHSSAPVKPGSMGRPMPGSDVKVVDEAGRPVANGELGEIALRLPHPQVMLGYFEDDARTKQAYVTVDGVTWHLTGDRGYCDEDNYFFYEGRNDDIIKSAGYRIGPMEVENALIEHPAVIESAVVGIPDRERGEIVKAFIVLRAGQVPSDALRAALQDHVKSVTAPYKYPRAIDFVDTLPKSAAGKLLRRVLRDAEMAKAEELAMR